ncbi:MAG: hypothetical protein IPG01_00450 [Chitinophagaceae bacterium]|nr:hypothetical protein [Chitinophagaceae bacterium]
MCKYFLIALVAGSVSIRSLHAQCLGGCCSSANTSGLSQQANIPERGKWIIGTNLLTMQYQPLSDEELLSYATQDASVYSVRSQGSLKGTLSYGLSRKIVLTAMLPYNYSTDNKEGHYHEEKQSAEIHSYGSIHGLGDGVLAFSYRLIENQESGWKAFAGAGIKVPTGTTSAYSTYAVVLPVHLQPGTGSWDPVVSASVQKAYNRLMFQTEARVRIATTAKDHNMGTYANAGILAGYDLIAKPNNKFMPSLNCSGGLAVDYNAPMKIATGNEHLHGSDTMATGTMVIDPNTGFTRLLINFMATAFITERLFIPLSFSIPMAQQLQGYQSSSKFTASIGVSFIIN